MSLFTDVSSEMLVYILPLYLANVLAAPVAAIGLIEGVAESTASVLKLISGALSDRLARRRLLVGIGYGTSVVAKMLYLVAVAWPIVLIGRVGDRFGKGIRTSPRDALIADSTAQENRGVAYGFHRAMDTTGAFGGVLIAAAVIWIVEGGATQLTGDAFRILVLLALIPGIGPWTTSIIAQQAFGELRTKQWTSSVVAPGSLPATRVLTLSVGPAGDIDREACRLALRNFDLQRQRRRRPDPGERRAGHRHPAHVQRGIARVPDGHR